MKKRKEKRKQKKRKKIIEKSSKINQLRVLDKLEGRQGEGTNIGRIGTEHRVLVRELKMELN